MIARTLKELARALGGEVNGDQVLAPAPGHSAKDRGMSVKLGRDGRPLVNLFNGGDPLAAKDYVCRKCGLEPFKPNGKAKAECSGGIRHVTRQVIYDYCDPASGEVRYRKRRIERADGSKTFAIEPKGRGGSHPLLYGGERLADLVEGQAVWIVEGEKQVDRLRDLGAIAVSGDSGASSKWLPEHAELLCGLRVILWPDSDEPGEGYVANAAAGIGRKDPGADLRVVRPFAVDGVPGSRRDVCDWAGGCWHLGRVGRRCRPVGLAGTEAGRAGRADGCGNRAPGKA